MGKQEQIQLPIDDLSGGKNDFIGLLKSGQFVDSLNMEFFNGELRTRGGQRLVLMTNPPNVNLANPSEPNLDTASPDNGGAIVYNGASTIGDLTIGQSWYFRANLKPGGGGVELDSRSNNWKCIGALFIKPAGVVNVSSAVVSYSYWSIADNAWRQIGAREYDLSTGAPAVATAHAGSRCWMVLFGGTTDLQTQLGTVFDDEFFEDWGYATVLTSPGYWIRVQIESGTDITTNSNCTQGYPIMAWRPQAMMKVPGKPVFAVATPNAVRRPEAVAGVVSQSYRFEAFQDVTFRGAVDTGLAADEATSHPHEALRTHHALSLRRGDFDAGPYGDVLPTCEWVTPSNTSGVYYPTQGRIYLPNECMVYVPGTDRFVMTTRSGLASLKPNTNEIYQYPGTAPQHTYVFEDFPAAITDKYESIYGATRLTKDLSVQSGAPRVLAYGEGRLWCGYEDGVIRWSAAVPYEDVWPESAWVQLPDAQPIRALVAYGHALIVFTQGSIWILEDAGVEDPGSTTAVYKPRLAAKGVGAVNQQCVVEVAGSLVFLTDHGVYAFDGANDPQLLSKQLNRTFEVGVNHAGLIFSTAVHYKVRGQVWFSVPRAGSWHNDMILVWDYKNGGGWFVLDGIGAEQMSYDEATGQLYCADRFGLVWEQNVGTRDGVAGDLGIPCFVETGPFSGSAPESFQPLDLFIHGRHYVGSAITVTPIADETEGAAQDVRYDRSTAPGGYLPTDGTNELQWGAAGFTWVAGAIRAQVRRKSIAGIQANDTNDLRVRVALKNQAGGNTRPNIGDVLSLFGVTLFVNPIGIRDEE